MITGFSGKMKFTYSQGLYVEADELIYANIWTLDGKTYNTETYRYQKLLPYASVVYASPNGDIWYYAPQNKNCMPVVRISDRNRIYDVLSSLGCNIDRTEKNAR